jgi:DNA modification methylase
MTPYYEHAGIKIYHGDCRDVLEAEDVNSDLLCMDPPYGIGMCRGRIGGSSGKGGFGGRKFCRTYPARDWGESDWDDVPAADDLIEICRGAAPAQVIWGGNYFHLPPSMRWLVWDKRNDGTGFADCELAWTNQRSAVRIFRHRWNGMLQEYGGRSKELRLHPTMKPLSLMKWCIGFFPDAKSVLDPFMGSGTTLVAAKAIGLSAVGIEREEKYCEIAATRLSQEVFDFGGSGNLPSSEGGQIIMT